MSENGGKEQTFTVTEDHLLLARAMNVRWDGCEYGAPVIDCKRPYGNSDVPGDIARILGWEFEAGEDYPESLLDAARDVHAEMLTVLQIILATGSFKPGDYRADPYRSNWSASPVSEVNPNG